jgi:hypothetical protein
MKPYPLPIRILSNAVAIPVAIVTAPVWLPIALYLEKKRSQ